MILPKVLVVGGAGTFGSRLAEGLASTLPCHVVIGGRDLDKARAAVNRLQGLHPRVPATAAFVDLAAVDAARLRGLGLAAVADAAGPFQGAGFRLPRACIEAGIPYVDIADARTFVTTFPVLDAEARAAGVPLLTGASSTPALSNAALDALVAGWRSVTRIEVAISPGNRAPRGLSVMQAILAYVGRPVRVRVDGAWTDAPGWGLTERRDMAGLGPRLLSLCETPDLDIMFARYRDADTVLFRAGLELGFLHQGLRLAALTVRAGLLPSLVPLAGSFRRAADLFTGWGGDRGGMDVTAWGTDASGAAAKATWSLLAEAGDGPFVPTLPALTVIRRYLNGPAIAPGAHACVGVLSLQEIEAEMARLRIRTWRDPPAVAGANLRGAA